ncbi:DUF6493 family protein [Klebsiella aerogenes]|uniref:DUF7824 domain-containing protein n=1 Tax=Klebsiella aerogenes TaxID=548 RepID=UPI002DBDAA9E|nr:DUF6493 family protein [Klebsiella aerogenes]MEB5696038.1 DUF6493 family protein [Klebsiella aerogenes]
MVPEALIRQRDYIGIVDWALAFTPGERKQKLEALCQADRVGVTHGDDEWNALAVAKVACCRSYSDLRRFPALWRRQRTVLHTLVTPRYAALHDALVYYFSQSAVDYVDRVAQESLSNQYSGIDFRLLSWGFHRYQKEAKARLRPWIECLSWVLKHLKTHAGLPLLPTPTHNPCFVDPSILVERLYRYQQAWVEPCSQDVQLALQRCVSSTNAHSVDKLSGEYGALMSYMLSGDRHAVAQISHDDWKLAAIITRSTTEPQSAAKGSG